jgi:hypothetical protein
MNYNNSKDLFQGLSNESIAKRTFAEINMG